MVSNTQSNFNQALAYKSLLCCHILPSWIRQMCNNQFYRSVCSKFVCTLGTIFIFIVTNIHILNDTNRQIDEIGKWITISL